MRSKKLRTALLGGGLFIAGWAAGQIIGSTSITTLPPVIGAAQAQADWPGKDPNIVALMWGVATVAVDTEAAAIRINELADRLAALERRVVQLEAQDKRRPHHGGPSVLEIPSQSSLSAVTTSSP